MVVACRARAFALGENINLVLRTKPCQSISHTRFESTGTELPSKEGNDKHVTVVNTYHTASNYERKSMTRKGSLYNQFRDVMSRVPSAVVVVTACARDDLNRRWLKRGVTCSSFTSVSMVPPIISFCMNNPSRMHTLMLETQRFAVNILAAEQVHYAVRFSKNVDDSQDQFDNIYHQPGMYNIPLLRGASAHIECKACSVHEVGDHHVWYGHVIHATSYSKEPLLYYGRTFRNIGDEAFIKAFEDRTLLFEDWTHEAHIRMAWNYVKEYGKDRAIPMIKDGIQRYNEVNKDKISRGYNETVTMFYIHMIDHALRVSPTEHETFDSFLSENQHLLDRKLLFKYYSTKCIESPLARHEFLPPDVKELP